MGKFKKKKEIKKENQESQNNPEQIKPGRFINFPNCGDNVEI